MVDLPRLCSGNTVAYASDESLRASAETYLTKGALAVLPEVELAPLAMIEVQLTAPRLDQPLLLQCEVVVLQPERALLRIVEPPPGTFTPYTTLPEPPGGGAPGVKEPPAAEAPPEVAPAHAGADSDDSENDKAEETPAPTLPPYLSAETLRFASEQDFNVAGRDLYLLGAVMAACDQPPLPGERRALKLQIGSRLAETPVHTTLQLGPGGMVVVELEQRDELARVLPEVLPPKTPPDAVLEREEGADPAAGDDDSGRGSRASVALVLERKGPLWNPTTADGVLALAVTQPLTPEHLALPNTHLLLRWLLTSKGTVRVDIEMAGHPMHPFVVMNGREVRSAVAMPTLGRNLVEPEGRYVVVDLKRPPRMTHGGTMLQLMQEVVSGLVGKLADEALERGLERHQGRCPQLNDVGKRLLEGLGFSSSHKRLAQKALTGRESVYDVTQHAAGARSAFEVLYTLEISGGLDWVDGDGVARAERQRKERERLDRLVEGAAGLWEKIQHANHFEALGLHWSTPPRKIKPVFDELERLYGPGGEARKEAAEVCERIWAKVSDAYAVLSDSTRRRAHRKEAYPLKWSAQIDVLLDRADIAMYRKDFEDSYDLLMVCQDIQPTAAAADRLVKLKEAQTKARARSRDVSFDE